jgi:DNA polymerase III delta prime subunit
MSVQSAEPASDVQRAWDQFIYFAGLHFRWEKFDEIEREYKLRPARVLERARAALLNGEPWQPELERAFKNQAVTRWQSWDRFGKWLRANPDDAEAALRVLWSESEPAAAQFDAFLDHIPRTKEVLPSPGERINVMSFLLLGLDAERYPPFKPSPFWDGWKLLRYPLPPGNASRGELYAHALAFLDRIVEEANSRGLLLRDRLDAQSVLWTFFKWDGEGFSEIDREAYKRFKRGLPPPPKPQLADLADELLLDASYLQKVRRLLDDKRQVIFYGPPGTGKTYVARRLARFFSGDPDEDDEAGEVRLVQFHPSYSYEDFVEGYRPARDGSFELRQGPLKQLAEAASHDPNVIYVLVIDEINRGNIAKVFGELYFLLEYRDERVSLLYSDDAFQLPPNLWIIGTMNTADRSIALLDTALRRRFHFVPFFPDEPPVEDLLRRWLARNKPELVWVADRVDAANALLGDRHAAIGPSHFMRANLDEEWVRLIWEHSVLPYIAEHYYGEEEQVSAFALDALALVNTPTDNDDASTDPA